MPLRKTVKDQQQHSYETLLCQRHHTILRLLFSAARQAHGDKFANFIVRPRKQS